MNLDSLRGPRLRENLLNSRPKTNQRCTVTNQINTNCETDEPDAESGICASRMTPSATETTPKKTAQPQRGNFIIPAAIARNIPYNEKARKNQREACSSGERIADQQISGESSEQRAEKVKERIRSSSSCQRRGPKRRFR